MSVAATDYDIIILGGGLVGASLGCALRGSGLRVLLVDALDEVAQTQGGYARRVLALSHSSRQIFSGLGLWADLQPVTPIHNIHVSDKGHFGFTRLHCASLSLPAFGYTVTAGNLTRVLWQALRHSDIELLVPAVCTRIKTDQQAVSLTLKQPDMAGKRTVSSCLLVIAEGNATHICRELGVDYHEQTYNQCAVSALLTLKHSHQHIAYERFTVDGPLALLPCYDEAGAANQYALIWTRNEADAAETMALPDCDFLATLQQQFGWRAGRFVHSSPRQIFPLRHVQLKTHHIPRTVIIGNAAHTLHPVAGQGFNLGLRDAAVLTEYLRQARENDAGNADLLKQYEHIQRRDQQRTAIITDTLVKTFSNTLPSLVLARNLGLLLMDAVPPLKQRFARQMAGLGSYPSHLVRGLSC